jgi:hypothetical protein
MPLEQLVHSLIGREQLDGLKFGIELEYEGWEGYREEYDEEGNWILEGDPSLRQGGIEFISIPLSEQGLREALTFPEKVINETGLKATQRCGVHVHLNVKPMTLGQLWSLSCLYTLLEPTIFKFWCPERVMSHFCVPSYANTMLQNQLLEDITQVRGGGAAVQRAYDDGEMVLDEHGEEQPRLHIRRHRPRGNRQLRILGSSKYCAMSYYRLHDLGTVEMRQLEGTTDMDRVYRWARFLGSLWHKAMKYNEPLDLLNEFAEVGIKGLCADVELPNLLVDPLDQSEAIEAAMIMAGYNVPNWRDLEWNLED